MSWMGLRWLPGLVFQVSPPWPKVSQESLFRRGWESIWSKTRPAGLEDPFPLAARRNSEMSWMGLPFPRAAQGNSEMSWMGLVFCRSALSLSDYTPS